MRRPGQPRALADLIAPSIGEAARAQGFSNLEILTRWPEIVGADLAPVSEPLKLQWPPPGDPDGRGATLIVRVEGTHALDLQFSAPQVIARINQVFGWSCVARLALRQGPVNRPAPRAGGAREPDPALVEAERATLTEIEDDGLRDSLARFGVLVRTRKR